MELTSRQIEVTTAICEGKSNSQIAQKLGLKVKTVEKHRESMYRTLQITGPARLVHFALARNLVGALPPALFAECVFTPRQLDIVKAVAEGRSNRQMARKWKRSVKTVEKHRNFVIRKMFTRERLEKLGIRAGDRLIMTSTGVIALVTRFALEHKLIKSRVTKRQMRIRLNGIASAPQIVNGGFNHRHGLKRSDNDIARQAA